MFFKRQVLVKTVPGEKVVPSGTVISAMNCALSQFESEGVVVLVGVGVYVEVAGVSVPVGVGVSVGGVPVTVAVKVGVMEAVGVGVCDALVPETTISTHQGLLLLAPMPNS